MRYLITFQAQSTQNGVHDQCMNTQDQPFSFRKHVRFGDRSQVPDLKLDTGSDDQQNLSQANPRSSTPHHGTKLINRMFNVSHIPPLAGSPQDAVAIAAEVSAAVSSTGIKGVLPLCETQKLPSSREVIWLMPS